MTQLKSRFFIALLPPTAIQDYVKELHQYCGDRYASHGAQKSPPHMTLQPPFTWLPEQVSVLEQCLSTIASQYQSHSTGLVPFHPVSQNLQESPSL